MYKKHASSVGVMLAIASNYEVLRKKHFDILDIFPRYYISHKISAAGVH